MRAPSIAVQAEGLSKQFGTNTVLDEIDLKLDRGEITLLMGPNGEGKTVLLCCLAGGLHPSTGRAIVLGQPADTAGDQLSLLLQGSVGLPSMTGPENARFYAGLHPASSGAWRRLLERFGMTDTSTVLKHCSAGMRRKVELAIALDPDVPVVLLDEPSAALDLGTLHSLHRVIRERRDAGHTVILTSHSPLDAQLADRIVFVSQGSVVADGPPDALLDALPDLVRLRGAVHEAIPLVRPRLRAGYTYGSGPEIRGFLPSNHDIDHIAAAVTDLNVTVDRDEPTTLDLYEYFATVRHK